MNSMQVQKPEQTDAPYTRSHSYGESREKVLGITTVEIENIVHNFYTKVRNDELLAPIFEKEMTEDWDHHLAKMCDFWTTVMFGVGLYKGNPMKAHSQIPNLEKAHFDHWLKLFEQTLTEVCPNKDHVEEFLNRATKMAAVLNYRRN